MIDFIKIKVKAGDGGKGCVAWRHEKFYANGGPFGGDGGKGGDVWFQVDTNETTLTKLRFTKRVKAGNGMPGLTKKMHGKSGEDAVVSVPLGTMIRNAANNDLLADLTQPGQKVLIAHGGRGGLGNPSLRQRDRKSQRIPLRRSNRISVSSVFPMTEVLYWRICPD